MWRLVQAVAKRLRLHGLPIAGAVQDGLSQRGVRRTIDVFDARDPLDPHAAYITHPLASVSDCIVRLQLSRIAAEGSHKRSFAPDTCQLAAVAAAPLAVFRLKGHPCLGLDDTCCLARAGTCVLCPWQPILRLLQRFADAGEAGESDPGRPERIEPLAGVRRA